MLNAFKYQSSSDKNPAGSMVRLALTIHELNRVSTADIAPTNILDQLSIVFVAPRKISSKGHSLSEKAKSSPFSDRSSLSK
jgi:hypothetical protein